MDQKELKERLLLSNDAEKVFLHLVLEKMGFNTKSVAVIKTQYNRPTSENINNWAFH